MTDLKRFISEQQAKKHSRERHVGWEERKKRWLDELEQLFLHIRHSLIDAGLDPSAFVSTSHLISEDTLGSYTAPGLRVQMPAGVVQFTPIASVIIGGLGRVDVEETGRGNRIKLIAQQPEGVSADVSRRDWLWRVYPGIGVRKGFDFDDVGLVRLFESIVGE
ncbi:hypothetical protein H0Z09_09750 [Pseudomonas sp. SWRI18]|uniref:hypothetical protein n=1 Tax=Pseudomonas sp. SWRI18 TaxID=2753888 RepID=UPI001648F0A2|nr:hypothetical protein [Pseudomonas sp. SWRI18]MBC3301407.1 hypothetical protein [Pseudomonas sp. SWRI18]